jgi:phosphinothricin acetyltransferase
MSILIRKMTPEDWPAVAKIYAEGIQTGQATFQAEVPTWEDWDRAHVTNCRLVALADTGEIMGWAALTPVSGRCVYAGVAEVSVYVGAAFRGQNLGSQLLSQLVAESEAEGFWTLQAGIFPENVGSVRIHEKAGFRIVGYRERIGQLAGVWRDTLFLERRSSRVGLPAEGSKIFSSN